MPPSRQNTFDSSPIRLTPRTVACIIVFVIVTTWGVAELRRRDIAEIASAVTSLKQLEGDVDELKRDVKVLRADNNENRVQYARIETRLNEIALTLMDMKKASK